MASRILTKIIVAFIFAVVITVPLFYMKVGIYPFIFDKTLFFQTLVEILFGLWLALAISDAKYRPKWTFLLKSLLVFVGVLILAALLGIDAWRSFFSTYERAFGVFAIMHMAAFAVVISSLRKELPWKWIFACSIATSVLVGFLGTLEFYYNGNLLLEQPGGRAGATFGNPTFLAGYLIWNIFLALYFLLNRNRSRELFADSGGSGRKRSFSNLLFSWPYLLVVILFEVFVLVFVTQTRGNIFGFLVGLFVLILLFAINPPRFFKEGNPEEGNNFRFFKKILAARSTYALVVVLIMLSGSIFWFTRASSFWSKVPGVERFRNVSLSSEELQPRLIALRAAWNGFLERPIFGWGPENFNVVFNKYYDPKALRLSYQETRFDKPHNFVAEDLVTGGIVLTVAHLLFLMFFVFAAAKNKDKLFGNIIIAATASYFVGNLFIFSTIGSDLVFYLLVGFLSGAGEKETNNVANNVNKLREEKTVPGVVVAICSGVFFVFAYFVNIRTLQASRSHFYGFVNVAHGKIDEGVKNFRDTLDIWSPYRWNFARDFAAVMSELYFYNPEIAKKEDVLEAISWMERARDEHPLDAYNHYALVDMYNEISDIDPKRFLPAAEKEGILALRLSPNRQQVYFSLAKTRTLEGDYPTAIKLAKYALSLDDQVADSHFYYGLLLAAHGDIETGYVELKTAIKLGRKWKNFHEPLAIGNLLADAGRIDDAIQLYAISVIMAEGQDKLEAKTKLGIAFYFAGQIDKAKEELQYVAEKFDFRKSQSFENLKPILDKLGVIY